MFLQNLEIPQLVHWQGKWNSVTYIVKVRNSYLRLCTKGKVNINKHIATQQLLVLYRETIRPALKALSAVVDCLDTDHLLPLQTWPGPELVQIQSINLHFFIKSTQHTRESSQTSHQNTAINNKIHCDWILVVLSQTCFNQIIPSENTFCSNLIIETFYLND